MDNSTLACDESAPCRRIVVTGASGFVGGHLCRHFLRQGYQVVGLYCQRSIEGMFESDNFQAVKLDLADLSATADFFSSQRIDAVIHAAAMANASLCEKDPRLAMKINSEGTGNLLVALEKCLSKPNLIHISTDLLFDGYAGVDVPTSGFSEEDSPRVASVYSKTKLWAEQQVLKSSVSGVVARISIVYGPPINNKSCFLGWMDEALSEQKELALFSDEFRRPLWIGDLGPAFETLLGNFPKNKRVFHLSGPQRVSRFEFGLLYAKARGFDSSLIVGKKREEVPSSPARAEDVSLDNSLFKITFDLDFTPIEKSLNESPLL